MPPEDVYKRQGCYLSDGVHLTMLGLQKWYEYLAANLGPQCSPGAELSSGLSLIHI